MGERVEGSVEWINIAGDPLAASAVIPIARRHRPWWDAAASWLVACAGVVNVLSVQFLCSGVDSFENGRRNVDPPFPIGRSEAVSLLLWVISGVVLAWAALAGPLPRRWFARGALLVCVAALPMECYTRPLPGERYDLGFQDWAARHVPVDAVRKWNTTLTPVAVATPVGAGQWPADVARLSPSRVTQLAGGQGVVLEWGVVASWGTARWVVACAGATVAPPLTEHFIWKQVGDGVYAAFQITN